MMKQIGKRTAAAAAAVLFFSTLFPVFAADRGALQSQADAAREDYSAASSALEDLNRQVEENQGQVDGLQSQITALTGQLGDVAAGLQSAQDELAQARNEADAAAQALQAKEQELQQRYDASKEQLAAMEFLGQQGGISILMQARDMYELLTFWQVLADLTSENKRILSELDEQAGALKEQQAQAEQAAARAEEARQALDRQQTALREMQNQLAAELAQASDALDDSEAAAAAQEMVTEEKRRLYEQATAELDAYLKAQSQKYGNPALRCSLDFGSPLPSIGRISTYFGEPDAVYGKPHNGTDFPAAAGTPVYAVADGVVTAASTRPSYGNCVQIDHGTADDGASYATLYAHLQSFTVSAGQSVRRGAVIGYVGNTGDVRGANGGYHLHLELRINGTRTDPLPWIGR